MKIMLYCYITALP